jgi:RHS repeat-associated protein
VNDLKPFSETKFDGSPLNRVVEQGAPGVDWQPHAGATDFNGHTVKMEYGTNISGEVLLLEVDNSGECKRNGYYQPNQLYKTISKDENWTTGGGKLHTTEEFKDKLGQVILKRSYVTHTGSVVQVDTYYVYDDFGLLRFVIPPKAVELLKKGGSADATPANGYKVIEKSTNLHAAEANVNKYFVKQGASLTLQPGYHFKARSGHSLEIKSEQLNMTEFNELIYAYKYDGRKRMIYKKLPGAAPVYMVYDSRDRLVASQDGNQREENQWLVNKYDVFNRLVLTALYIPELKSGGVKKNGEDLKEDVDKFYANTNNRMYESRLKNSQYYDSKSFPKDIQDGNILTKSYYGNYPNVSGIPNAYDAKWLANSEVLSEPKGQLTATWVKSMNADNGKNSGLWSVSFYDKKYRVVQTYVQNYLGGQDITSNEYDFVGKVKRSIRNHTANGNDITESKWFSYDHAGRMTKIEQAYSGSVTKSRATISEMEYDELGQLKQKKLPVIDRDLEYAYNIRGWMNSMSAHLSIKIQDKQSDDFGFKLFYQQYSKKFGGDNQFNGNIGAIEWWGNSNYIKYSSSDDSAHRIDRYLHLAYGFQYDALNRLIKADYRERINRTNGGSSPSLGGDQLREDLDLLSGETLEENEEWSDILQKFDVDGICYDLNGNITNINRYGKEDCIDKLDYGYVGNRLIYVNDRGKDQIGFKEISEGKQEYRYDANGNMKSDTNKGISKIHYNFLNLPENITKGSKRIEYTYSAIGEKLENRLPSGKKLQYCGDFVYQDGSLRYILSEEGKLIVGGSHPYQFFIKDHLGNIRIVVGEGEKKVQELNNYYPFGMRMDMNDIPKIADQNYLYNGKELQEETDWLDYGFRMYDAALARWHVIDGHAETYYSWSPYNYVLGNPINLIDWLGLDPVYRNGKYYETDDDGNEYEVDWNYVNNWIQNNDGIAASYSFSTAGGETTITDTEKGNTGLGFTVNGKEYTANSYMTLMGRDDRNNNVGDFSGIDTWSEDEVIRVLGHAAWVIYDLYYGGVESAMFGESLTKPDVPGSGKLDYKISAYDIFGLNRRSLIEINGIVYNANEAGNFLWGMALEYYGGLLSPNTVAQKGTQFASNRDDERWEQKAISAGRAYGRALFQRSDIKENILLNRLDFRGR